MTPTYLAVTAASSEKKPTAAQARVVKVQATKAAAAKAGVPAPDVKGTPHVLP